MLGFLLLLPLAAPSQAQAEDPFRPLAFDAACAEAASAKKVVMIDFFTTWCPPCKKLDKVTWVDESVRVWLAEKTVPIRVDAEQETELAERFHVRAYPSLVFVLPDGTELGRIVGFRAPKEFTQEAGDILAGTRPSERARKEAEGAGNDDPMLRQKLADKLVQEGKLEEALEEYLWCFDHGAEASPSYFGVRLSFLLSDIVDLGRDLPRAIHELKERRDAAKAAMLAGTATPDQGMVFSAIAGELDEKVLTLELWDALKAVEPKTIDGRSYDPRPMLFRDVFDALIEARRYEDAAAGLRDAEKALKVEIGQYEYLSAMRPPTPPGHEDDETLKEAIAEGMAERLGAVVEKGGKIYEALLGAKRDADAVRVARRLLAFDASEATREVLREHARRAGRDDAAAGVGNLAPAEDEKKPERKARAKSKAGG